MIYTIKRGKHRAFPLRFGLWRDRHVTEFIVKFGPTCRYDLKNVNQADINKLFGLGFITNPVYALLVAVRAKLGGGIYKNEHHKESVRVGWRYNVNRDAIELWSYCYVNEQRVTQFLGECRIGREYSIKIDVKPMAYWLSFQSGFEGNYNSVPYFHAKRWSYPLEIYFGGDEPAPHDMHIELKKP